MRSAGRNDRRIQDPVHDAYRPRRKLAEPASCTRCGLVYHRGRWLRGVPRPGSRGILCPACQRTLDDYPGGIVELHGTFLEGHLEEVLNTVRNVARAAEQRHPLQRIIRVHRSDGCVSVTTTDSHLARAIGEALKKAFQGELELKYSLEGDVLRVHWTR
ncbi:MAG: hypothetical protein KatS3mg076_0380 [Candidatus Binatia bacterium]|nr:MAG: hypothetical protein KatS3mg076_0380 [Candidatus Binatia bacterium]